MKASLQADGAIGYREVTRTGDTKTAPDTTDAPETKLAHKGQYLRRYKKKNQRCHIMHLLKI